jgi:hypothetical protein
MGPAAALILLLKGQGELLHPRSSGFTRSRKHEGSLPSSRPPKIH